MRIKVFSSKYLDDLVGEAVVSQRRRRHRNVHLDYSEPCQRLFNAIEPDSYLRPHCHGSAQGSEMMIAVRGLMALILFSDIGEVEQILFFGSDPGNVTKEVAVGVEVFPGVWHSVVSLKTGSILLEVKSGPFDPSDPKRLAHWAPEEGSADAQLFFEKIRNEVIEALSD